MSSEMLWADLAGSLRGAILSWSLLQLREFSFPLDDGLSQILSSRAESVRVISSATAKLAGVPGETDRLLAATAELVCEDAGHYDRQMVTQLLSLHAGQLLQEEISFANPAEFQKSTERLRLRHCARLVLMSLLLRCSVVDARSERTNVRPWVVRLLDHLSVGGSDSEVTLRALVRELLGLREAREILSRPLPAVRCLQSTLDQLQ